MPRKRPQVLGGDLNRSELSHSLISQDFLPESDTNRRFRRTLRNKRFFGASDTTANQRARSSCLPPLANSQSGGLLLGAGGFSLARAESSSPFRVASMSGSNGRIRRKEPYTCGKDCLPLPGDEQVGQHSRQQLIRMDSDFVPRWSARSASATSGD